MAVQGQPKLPSKGLLRKQKQLADKTAKAEGRRQGRQTDRLQVSACFTLYFMGHFDTYLAGRRHLLAVQVRAALLQPPKEMTNLVKVRHFHAVCI